MKIDKQDVRPNGSSPSAELFEFKRKLDEALLRYETQGKGLNGTSAHVDDGDSLYEAARILSDILPHLEEMKRLRGEFSVRLGASNDDAEFIFAADCAPKLDEIINILEGENNSN